MNVHIFNATEMKQKIKCKINDKIEKLNVEKKLFILNIYN